MQAASIDSVFPHKFSATSLLNPCCPSPTLTALYFSVTFWLFPVCDFPTVLLFTVKSIMYSGEKKKKEWAPHAGVCACVRAYACMCECKKERDGIQIVEYSASLWKLLILNSHQSIYLLPNLVHSKWFIQREVNSNDPFQFCRSKINLN